MLGTDERGLKFHRWVWRGPDGFDLGVSQEANPRLGRRCGGEVEGIDGDAFGEADCRGAGEEGE